MTSSSLEATERKSSSESIAVAVPVVVTGVGGAASGSTWDGESVAAVVEVVVVVDAAAEAKTRCLLGALSDLVDDIFASAAFLFLVMGGILAVVEGYTEGKRKR